ncbi:uncharacterized protein LOC101858044 [Aplysia californica]|uniref:Uncharacterized protein LOC101858044 n=1 Tax=Aplysia californica TaxID=6500 RepID=A0ABM1VWS8_APLCA|nr:uncharacterized protein LOC101858044 [Aplysia californica]
MTNVNVLAGTSMAFVGFLLCAVGMGTEAWITFSKGGVSPFSLGLSSASGAVDAVQALTVIGVMLAVAGICLGVAHLVFEHLEKEPLPWFLKAAGGCLIGGGIFMIIGDIIWLGKIYFDVLKAKDDLGYSFYLCIVGGLILLASGGVILKEKKEANAVNP